MLEMRAAAGSVSNNGIKLFRRNLVDLLARELLSQRPLPVVRVQRTAAELPTRSDNFATILRQNFRRVAVDVAENQVLRAAGEQRNAVTPRSDCRSDCGNQLLRKLRL